MDLKLGREAANNCVEKEEGALRGKHQYYPFRSSASFSQHQGFTALSNHHHHRRPQMVTWLGDHNFKPHQGGNPVPDFSMKNIEFTDLSMNLHRRHEKAEGGEEDGRDAGKSKSTNREVVFVKEHMFDKVVTPSDVGKLNRLVIPKQHAEQFFPLDSSMSDKGGLLLSFEDCTGKSWQFRYSYWNSSQSYVMTKGWSRFVKEKKLNAGDIVSFQRGIGDKDRLFIDWRHKPKARPEMPMAINYPGGITVPLPHSFSFHRPAPTEMWNINRSNNFQRDHGHYTGLAAINGVGVNPSGSDFYGNAISSKFRGNSVIYLRPSGAAPAGGRSGGFYGGRIDPSEVFESVSMVQAGTKVAVAPNKRQLRLFGVDMDYPMSESDDREVPNKPSSSKSSPYPQLSVFNGLLVPPNRVLDKGKESTSSLT
ncbi:hypothetical protein SAY87_024847 [Trapa incisa]|uniref:TF-B3 domain-containing protein n=1 Tax=Trapa incisa TaxID=236973 RepID=A0AAN7GGK2_9MYRT|nr:hypothetical protein SAY87_024847 [Trapa incisa]